MDFCTIFANEMDSLYSLALLLTADGELAEACFLGALEDCRNAPEVFRERASSWSRRAIIKRAIQRMRPAPQRDAATGDGQRYGLNDIPLRLLQLRTFERFVFAMSVLERYSAWECATLLDCRLREVVAAQISALKALGGTLGERVLTFNGAVTQQRLSAQQSA
jgi:hypothetical protein